MDFYVQCIPVRVHDSVGCYSFSVYLVVGVRYKVAQISGEKFVHFLAKFSQPKFLSQDNKSLSTIHVWDSFIQ